MGKRITDDEIDRIAEEAQEAATHAWGPLGAPNAKRNPYTGERAEVWEHAFRSAYARENGY